MSIRIWRAFAALIIGFGIIYVILDTSFPTTFGNIGLSTALAPMADGTQRVVAVDPNGSAAKAGIVVGDLVRPSRVGPHACSISAAPNALCGMTIVRPGSTRHVLLLAQPATLGRSWSALFTPTLLRLSFLFMAALLIAKRSEDPAARALATFFGCFGLAAGSGLFRLHSSVLISIAAIVVESLFIVGGAAALRFATLFPRPDETGVRYVLGQSTPLLASLAIASSIVRLTATLEGHYLRWPFYLLVGYWVYVCCAVVTSLTVAFLRSTDRERARLRWVAATFAFGFSGLVAYFLMLGFGLASQYGGVTIITLIAIPFGLGYVMLRHRLLDITFVVNRALVFAFVSAFVVAVFVVVETLLGRYVEQASQASHVTSVVVQLIVALVLGFSIRAIHARVDRTVDDVFFRSRRRDERMIAAFTHDAPLVTDEHTLLRRCLETTLTYAHAHVAGIWLRENNGVFIASETTFETSVTVDENDPAILAMRSRHITVDLVDVHSALPGIVAFPMIVRGLLVGVLVCGERANAESYDPDERIGLERLAQSVGHSLDALQVRALKREVANALSGEASFEAARPILERLIATGAA